MELDPRAFKTRQRDQRGAADGLGEQSLAAAGATRRLHRLHRHLASGESAAPLEALELPSVPASFGYFDLRRFRADHGPDEQPWLDARTAEEREADPAFTEQHGSKLLHHYAVPFAPPRGVMDGRNAPAGAISLDRHGFQLHSAPTAMEPADFYSRKQVMDVYLPEVEDIVRWALGCTRVLCFDSNIRNEQLGAAANNSNYARHLPHNDHTLVSGPRRVRELLAEDPANAECLEHRYGILNVWRRWDGGNAWPLCCCSYDSMDYDEDMVRRHLVYSHRTGEGYTAAPGVSAPSLLQACSFII